MSSKKLRNVRFEVPQMSEEMGGLCCFKHCKQRSKPQKRLELMRSGK